MDTKTFLAKVTPSKGNRVLWIKKNNTNISWNVAEADLDSYVNTISKFDQDKNLTVYLAVATFTKNIETNPDTGKRKVRRTQAAATWFKSLAVDIDVGGEHIYQDFDEAKQALMDACENLGLPKPMVVRSGRGLHAWFPFVEEIKRDTWEKMSISLRLALKAEGVEIDPSKIHDPSMVLRPVGTHHKKDPNNWLNVELDTDAPERPAIEYARVLSKYKQRRPTGRPAKAFNKRQSAVVSAIMEGGAKITLDELHKCRQMAAIMDTNGKLDAKKNVVAEPLWRATLGIAKFCDNPEEAAIAFSSGHDGYDEAKTLEKLDRWKGTGPTLCKTIDGLCPEVCDQCPHKGYISTPVQLTGGQDEITVKDPETGETLTEKLPTNYKFKNNCIFYFNPILEEEVFVAPYKMWLKARVTDVEESTNMAKIIVDLPLVGTRLISVDASVIAAGGTDLRKAFADREVYVKEDITPLGNFLMTYLRKLQKEKVADNLYKHFGWQTDGTFLIGETVLGTDQEPHVHLDKSLRQALEFFQVAGEQDPWIKASALFDYEGLEPHNFAITAQIAAPLMKFTGIPGLLVVLYNNQSGTGKTLAGIFGQAAWGHPEKLILKPNATPNALYHQFGLRRNNAPFVDEITVIRPDLMGDFIYSIQNGKERDRLKSTTDGLREGKTWCTPVFATSNKDIHEMVRARHTTSEAEQLRVLQFSVPRTKFFEKGSVVGRKLYRVAVKNHGHIGQSFMQALLAKGDLDAYFDKMEKEFRAEFDFEFNGEERFYESVITITYVAGRILEEEGLIKYDFRKGIKCAIETVERSRVTRTDLRETGLPVLSQFLVDHQDSVVYEERTPERSFIRQPVPRTAAARIELEQNERGTVMGGTIYVNRKSLRDWLKDNWHDYSAFIADLKVDGVTVHEHVRKTLYKGVAGAAATGQVHCVAFDIASHPDLLASCLGTETEELKAKPRMEIVQ